MEEKDTSVACTWKREMPVIGNGGRALRLAEFVEVMEELGGNGIDEGLEVQNHK